MPASSISALWGLRWRGLPAPGRAIPRRRHGVEVIPVTGTVIVATPERMASIDAARGWRCFTRTTFWSSASCATGPSSSAREARGFDLVATDIRLSDGGGRDPFEAVCRIHPGTPVIPMTA